MTALCSGGTSSPNPGLGDVVTFTAAGLAALINQIPLPFAVAFASYLQPKAYHLADFCGTDPPGYPTFTADDFINLLSLNDFDAFLAAQRKLYDLVDTWVWYQSCHCDVGSTPAAPTPPSEPSGMPQINPPSVGAPYPTGQPCYSVDFSIDGDTGHYYGSEPRNPLNGATFVDWTTSHSEPVTNPVAVSGYNLIWLDSSGFATGSGAGTVWRQTGETLHATATPPSGAVAWTTDYQITGGAGPFGRGTGHADFYCNTTPGGAGGTGYSPCQPDALTQTLLTQILALVTLIQRQAVPFAYVSGPLHSALSGTGTVSVQGILGVLLNVSVPSRAGEIVGTPDTRFDVGWINFGTADGYSDRQFIQSDSQVVFPKVAGAYTLVAYTLLPDVSMSMTELVREP